VIDLTIAMIPVLTAAGILAHASTTAANSGSRSRRSDMHADMSAGVVSQLFSW
jgi:hypothetical protein